jgi:hypothetical protein
VIQLGQLVKRTSDLGVLLPEYLLPGLERHLVQLLGEGVLGLLEVDPRQVVARQGRFGMLLAEDLFDDRQRSLVQRFRLVIFALTY